MTHSTLESFYTVAFTVGLVALVMILLYVAGHAFGFIRECCQCGRFFVTWGWQGGGDVRCRVCRRSAPTPHRNP